MAADAISRYIAALQAEAREAEEASEEQAATRLRSLAATAQDMTPAETTWAGEATEEELRRFASSLRSGCAPEEDA